MRTLVLVLAGVLLAIFIVGGVLSLIPHKDCGATMQQGGRSTAAPCGGK